ncbi:unnamed protein product [Calypogeia fissa]
MGHNVNSNLEPQGGIKKHVLVVSVSVQAHIAGMLRFCMQLAKRGVKVSFICLKQDISLLKDLEELQALDINLISYNNSEEEAYILTFLKVVRKLFRPIHDKFVEDRKAGLPGPTCIMGDRFLPWLVDVAEELGVPFYQFWSCGAIFVRVLQAYPELLDDGTFKVKEEADGRKMLAHFHGHVHIPGLPPLEHSELTNLALGMDYYRAIGEATGKADAVISNTFYDMEAPIIEGIKQSWLKNSGGKKVQSFFPVGPLATDASFMNVSFHESDLNSRGSDYLKWLDTRAPQSVIYICLGSLVQIYSPHIIQLAHALEATKLSFVWVISKGCEVALPKGFQERTAEQGLIVTGWVAQLQVLQHSSIAGFLTHCGWNSILESVLTGVPMAAWPQLKNDHFFNCRYFVDVMKIAAEVKPQQISSGEVLKDGQPAMPPTMGAREPVPSEEFERVLRLLLAEEGQVIRSRILELKKAAEAAVADGGSSRQAVNDFVDFIPGSIISG